jgi:hypothetical protein
VALLSIFTPEESMKPDIKLIIPAIAAGAMFVTCLVHEPVPEKAQPQSSGRPSLPGRTQNKTATASRQIQGEMISSPTVGLMIDPSHPLHQRGGALRRILAHGTRSEVLKALAALASIHKDSPGDAALLCAEFGSPMSNQAVDTLADWIAGNLADELSPHAMPPEVSDAMRKGLQSQQNLVDVGKALENAWRTAPPDGRQRLEAQEIPALFASRAADSIRYDQGEALLWLARLETCAHPRTAESILALCANPSMPVAEVSDALYNWNQRFSGPESCNLLSSSISNPALSPVQQGISAVGLAGSPTSAAHIPAMHKAAGETANPWLRDTLQLAMQLAQENEAR